MGLTHLLTKTFARSLFTDTGFHGVVFSYSNDGDGDFENDQRDVIVDNNVFDGCAMSRDTIQLKPVLA